MISCVSYKGVKLLEHVMKIVERVLERQMQTLISLDLCQAKLVYAIFIVRKMQEE